MSRLLVIILIGSFLLFNSCNKQEDVNIKELLTEGAVTEITHAYPDFKVTLVSEKESNVSVKFGENSLFVNGIEKDEAREKIAKYVVQYLEIPNKKGRR